jgi:hypothetical protein
VRRSRLGLLVLVLLVAAALALIIALLSHGQGDGTASDQTTPTTLGAPVLIPIQSVTAFDPEGTGTPGENNSQVAHTFDDNPATTWQTEGYNQRNFGTKQGVGLIIQLAHPTPLRTLTVSSPTRGWAAQVFVSTARPTTAPIGTPAAVLTNIAGTAKFTLHSDGSTILLWITDLGSVGPRFEVTVSELKVRGGA